MTWTLTDVTGSDFEKNDDSLLGNFCVEIIRLIAAYLLNGAKIVSRSKKYDAFFLR